MKNHKEIKLFYKFLAENGALFLFLETIKTTKYKTLKEHCTQNKPNKYIINGYWFSRTMGLSNEKITQLDALDKKWKEQLILINKPVKNERKERN